MQQQSESIQQILQILRPARARADALVKALMLAQASEQEEARARARARKQQRPVPLRSRPLPLNFTFAPAVKQQVGAPPRTMALAGARAETKARTTAWADALARTKARADVRADALARAEAEARARARAQAWARARAGLQGWQVEAEVEVEVAKMDADAQAQVQAEANMITYGQVLADSELMDIIYSMKPEKRLGLAHRVWRHSEHWWLVQILAPITRLPQELLHQILLIIIDNANDSPLVLMRVSKSWYNIVIGIWASLKLGTSTPKDAVTRKLERNQWLLDVVIDTEIDRSHFFPLEDDFRSISAAIQAASRWRSLVVKTFPAQADVPEHLVNSSLQQCSDVVMRRLKSFKIKCPCEPSSLLQHLLSILGTATGGELTTVEINSPSVISFLAPTYPSIFHSVKVLCLDIPRLPNPVDLLPHLHQLEAFTASHLSLPIYPNDVDIPFVHTLRRLTLRAVSIQWMSGRTFHALESCTLVFPRHRQVQLTFSTTLPNCNDLTFQGYPLDILNGISARNLTHLTVACSCSEKTRASRQLVQFSSQALRENRLMPRVLCINIEATNQAWIKAFPFMSHLEDLVIEAAQPCSLGVKALQSLVVHPVHANNLGTTTAHGARYAPLCPSLKRFGLRYRRWLRPSENFDLIPELLTMILSRQRSKFSLETFQLWKGSDQMEPLQLIRRSWISLTAFKCLTNKGALRAEDLLCLVIGRLAEEVSKS